MHIRFILSACAAIGLACSHGASAAGAAQPAAAPVTAPVTAPAAPAYDLAADVERTMRTFDVPGIAIAVVKDGKVLVARGFGVRERGQAGAVDGKTVFEIASNSKAFTVAALATLVDQGKLAWDDPVTKHVPGFQLFDPYSTHAMTLRDLLSHRSGLGLGAGDLLWWPSTAFTTDEIIEKLRYLPPATSLRNNYAYNNLAFIVAGKVLSNTAGKPWGAAVRERILAPLGMDGTTTSLDENAGNPNLAHPHSKIDGTAVPVKPMPAPNAVGAVGINSNAEDLARWMRVLLDQGALAGDAAGQPRRLWSAAQAREMWMAQTPMRISEPKPALAEAKPNFLAYGLGFQLRDYRGVKLVLHGGALQGFYSRLLMVPEAHLGIAILTNAESGGALNALQYRLLDAYLGGAPAKDWIGALAEVENAAHQEERKRQAQASAARAAGSRPSLPLESYDGQYRDPWYGLATIKKVGQRHVLSFAKSPDLTGELEHWQHDTFIVRWRERNFDADAFVSFALKPDGSIERMKMAPLSTETDFSYDFEDLLFTPVKDK
ncbi:MAG: serine hydrolase [Pseudomonadota bacterium]